jgi:sulfoxide reductase heme-binding subunit YedZ
MTAASTILFIDFSFCVRSRPETAVELDRATPRCVKVTAQSRRLPADGANRYGSAMRGPRLLAIASLALVAMCATPLLARGWNEESLRLVVRATARTSLLAFLTAYVASPLRSLVRNDATRWLLATRRYVGLTYAVSHSLHLGAILALARAAPDFRMEPATLFVGGGAYVFLYAMALTSNDRAVRWLGLARWRLLHRTGLHYNWFIFAQSYGRRLVSGEPLYVVLGLAVLLAPVLRIAAYLRTRRRSPTG